MEKESYLLQKSLMKPSLLGRLGARRLPLIPVKLFFKNCLVLDVGCGNGIFLKLYRNAVGADANAFMVEDCLKAGLRAKRGDIHDLCAFESASFEGVLLSHVLEHVREPALHEVYRVLKPAGKLLIEVPINEAGFNSNPTHVHRFTEEELLSLVSSSGFKIVKSGYIMPFFKSYIHNHYRIFAVKAGTYA
jgi:SAM-dependent methyltransferase